MPDRDWISTACPGCGTDIVLYEDGTAIEPRREVPDGLRPTLDVAFKPHECDGLSSEVSSDTPPLVMYVVLEANRTSKGDDSLFISSSHLFADPDRAENEAEQRREAIEKANADARERDGMPHYEEWTVDVQEVHLSQYRLENVSEMDGERYEIMQDAVNAVGRSLLEDESPHEDV